MKAISISQTRISFSLFLSYIYIFLCVFLVFYYFRRLFKSSGKNKTKTFWLWNLSTIFSQDFCIILCINIPMVEDFSYWVFIIVFSYPFLRSTHTIYLLHLLNFRLCSFCSFSFSFSFFVFILNKPFFSWLSAQKWGKRLDRLLIHPPPISLYIYNSHIISIILNGFPTRINVCLSEGALVRASTNCVDLRQCCLHPVQMSKLIMWC